uniref:BRCT domain-containing protein n=1 Tax=Stomoxys calcitrans TaxID=35570 RepID=A0A1I8NZK9_STOCA
MPFASFSRVREVSSEDSQFPGENILKGKKWKTQNVGEKSAYIILEMDEAKITGIDIGNEHSAFVEVLVAKNPSDFKEILITCSFMTPIESRNSTNLNRVRCFSGEALVATVAEKKWTMVKIICTQPFNKHVQYGLSFIKVHVAPSQETKASNATSIKGENSGSQELTSTLHIGKFKLREDSPDSENDGSSSLFSRWKNRNDVHETTTAAAIRNASNHKTMQVRDVIDMPKTKQSQSPRLDGEETKVRDRNRNDLLFGEEDEVPKSKKEIRLAEEIEADKERVRRELLKQKQVKRKSIDIPTQINCNNVFSPKNPSKLMESTPPATSSSKFEKEQSKRKSIDIAPKNFSTTRDHPSPGTSSSKDENKYERSQKRPSSPYSKPSKKIKNSETQFRPFNQLLSGVVLVISGIQNPDRADLRSKALALGATYKSDWDKSCTHLICAFKNTPKYNQVKGKGKIVSRSWIEKCFKLKKYLPWRRYALDSDELKKPESDEEILDEKLKPQTEENDRRESEDRNETLALYDIHDEQDTTTTRKRLCVSSSDSDTDDEIKRVEKVNTKHLQQNRNNSNGECIKDKADIYDASTDEEEYIKIKRQNCG